MKKLLNIQPNIITNDRLHPDFPGNTKTPEQDIPQWSQIKKDENWETCMTMNGSWGYKNFDNKWKSSESLIRNLVKIAARGGNYLLNVGPKPDGTFPEESVQCLKEIGGWMDVNGEAIYSTQASPFGEIPWGECTLKEKGDKTILHFSVFNWPTNRALLVPGLTNKVISAKLLATDKNVKTSVAKAGTNIFVPETMTDPFATVIKMVVKGKVERNSSLDYKKQMQSGALE